MKKIFSLVVAAILLLYPTTMSVFAEESAEILMYENAEGKELTSAISLTKSTAVIEREEYAEDLSYGSVFEANALGNYGNIKFLLDNAISLNTDENEPNTYIEAEFDIKSDSANCAIKFLGNTKKFSEFYLKQNKLFINNSDNTSSYPIPVTGKTSEWNRYRFVLQLTDNDANSVKKLVEIYINGVKAENTLSSFDNNQSSFLGIIFEMKNTGETICIDNFSISKYTSDDGNSKAPDRFSLIGAVINAQSKLSENVENLQKNDYDNFKNQISDAVLLYNSKALTASEASDAVASMKNVIDEINALLSGGGGGEEETNLPCMLLNFENGETVENGIEAIQTIPSLSEEKLYSIKSDDKDALTLGKYLELKNSESTGVYPTFHAKFSPIAYNGTQNGQSCFVETELDFKCFNLASKSTTVRFYDTSGTKSRVGLVISGSNGQIKNEDTNEVVGQITDPSEWSRLRFVMRITDGEGNTSPKLVEIYQNERSVMTCSPIELKGSCYDAVIFTYSAKKTSDAEGIEFGICVDNITVTKYNGESTQTQRSALAVNLRTYTQLLESGHSAGSYDSEYDILHGEIATAAEVLNLVSSTPVEISEQNEIVKMSCNRLCALETMQKYDKTQCVYGCELSQQSLSGCDEVTVNTNVFTDINSELNATAVAMLFKKDDKFSGGRLLDIKGKQILLGKRGSIETKNTFDLQDYSEADKALMFIKAVVIKADDSLVFNSENSFFNKNEEYNFDNVVFTKGVKLTAEFDENKNYICSLNISGEKNEKLLLCIRNAESKQLQYINTVKTNSDGRARLDFSPQSGVSALNCDVMGDTIKESTSLTLVGFDTLETAFDRIYAEKSAESLESLKDVLMINGEIYRHAVENNVNIESVLKNVIGEKRYNPFNVNEFSSKLLSRLNLIYTVRSSENTDSIAETLSNYKNDYSAGSNFAKLSEKEKYKAAEKLFAVRNDVSDVESLNTEVLTAIEKCATANQNGSSGGSGGGSGGYAATMNSGTKIQNTPLTAGTPFSDISGTSWAEEAITAFYGMNIIDGRQSDKFAPYDNITREEFVKIAVGAFSLNTNATEAKFSDVVPEAWYSKYIASAAAAGIINGKEDGSFGVGEYITREETAAVIYRILVLKGKGITSDGVYIQFADEEFFSEYAVQAITELAKSGIVNGMEENVFMPSEKCNRAQAVKMLYEAYKRI